MSSFGRCHECRSHLLCAADCGNAPWNHDKPPVSRFLYLLRLRRWAGSPVGYGRLGVGISWKPYRTGRWRAR